MYIQKNFSTSKPKASGQYLVAGAGEPHPNVWEWDTIEERWFIRGDVGQKVWLNPQFEIFWIEIFDLEIHGQPFELKDCE